MFIINNSHTPILQGNRQKGEAQNLEKKHSSSNNKSLVDDEGCAVVVVVAALDDNKALFNDVAALFSRVENVVAHNRLQGGALFFVFWTFFWNFESPPTTTKI